MADELTAEQRREIVVLAQRLGPGSAAIARRMAMQFGPDAPGADRRVIQAVIRGRD